MAAWPLYEKLFGDVGLSDRPLFVIGAILAAFGVQLIGFGLIGEIIIFTRARGNKPYTVDRTVN